MDFHACSLPQANEPVFSKSTNSAFIRLPTPEPEPELELEKYLREKEIWKIYFVGLSVDLCLGSTVRSASDLGVADHVDAEGRVVKGDLVVVEDAVAAVGCGSRCCLCLSLWSRDGLMACLDCY